MHTYAVQLIADTNYIPIKYSLVAMDPNANLGNSDAVLVVRSYGWDTKAHYDAWLANKTLTTGRQGTLGVFSHYDVTAFKLFGT